jgi:hypothetical protein
VSESCRAPVQNQSTPSGPHDMYISPAETIDTVNVLTSSFDATAGSTAPDWQRLNHIVDSNPNGSLTSGTFRQITRLAGSGSYPERMIQAGLRFSF